MATDWTSIRIRRSTLTRLYAVRESLDRAAELGTYQPTLRHVTVIPLDDVINVLLDRDDRKRQRARESQKRRKQTPTPPESDSPVNGG